MGSVHDDSVYPIEARVPASEWRALQGVVAPTLLALTVDWRPHASGPEVALCFLQGGLSGPSAEIRARRRLEDVGLAVLAIKVDDSGERAAA